MDDGSRATNASAGAQDAKALSSAAAPGPTWIRSLDVLRGVGVLGVLATHTQLFAYPDLARWNPTAHLFHYATAVLTGPGSGMGAPHSRSTAIRLRRASWSSARASSGELPVPRGPLTSPNSGWRAI